MKNFDSILAAYLIGWAIFFGYYVSVSRRMNSLSDEISRLKDLVNRGK